MKTNEIYQKMSDGVSICIHSIVPEAPITKILVIVHGMAEHSLRYDSFAQTLAHTGFAVFMHDQRGHGKTAGDVQKYGYLGDGVTFERLVDDVHEIVSFAKSQYKDVPVVLLGHSFGSFISQRYIERYGDTISSCALSGTAGPRLPLMTVAKCLAKAVCAIFGEKHISRFLDTLAFGPYLKRIDNPRTKKDWVSRDTAAVDAYNADEACGFMVSSSFFREMFTLLATIHTNSEMQKIPKNLPLYLFAGDADPVGEYGKSVVQLVEAYKKIGIQNITLKLYPDGRHEMLNEINRDEVIKDIQSWL